MHRDGFRYRKWLLTGLGLYGLYLTLGWLSGPVARQPLLDAIEAHTQRQASLDSLVINPFTLSLTARDFRLQDHDGQPLLAFDRLYVNFQLSSLFRRSWHFRELTWEGPRLRAVRQDADTFNFSDLFATEDETEETAERLEAQDAEAFSLPAISVQTLRLVQAAVLYRDQHRAEPAELDLGPLDFALEDFSTRAVAGEGNRYSLTLVGAEGGRLDWTGQLTLEPMVLEGDLALSGLDLVPWVNFLMADEPWQLVSGNLDTALQYRLALGSDAPVLQVGEGRVGLKTVQLHWREVSEPALTLPALTVAGVRLDTRTRQLQIASLNLQQPMLRLRQQGGGLDWVENFSPPPPSDELDAEDSSAALPADSDAAESSPWQWQLDALNLHEGLIRFEDHSLENMAALELRDLAFSLGPLSSAAEAAFALQLRASLEDYGDLHLQGQGQLQPLKAELTLSSDALDMSVVQPWLQSRLNAQLASGRLKTALTFTLPESPDAWQLSGNVQLENLQFNTGDGQPLLTWSLLGLEGLAVNAGEQDVSIERVQWDGLQTAYRLDAEGQHNWASLLKTPETVADAEAAAATQESDTASWRLRLGRLALSQAELAYRDERTHPVFEIQLSRLGGQLDHWDMNSRRPARLNLNARVNRQSPLVLSGTLRPAADALAVDMQLQLQDYAMTELTPFTGRFVGFAVERGQLNLDSAIMLQGTVLESRTGVRAEDFHLGERVESPEAINLPVKLGLTVLRDRQGVIDLPVAINGDLSDPSVTVSGLILRALLNVLNKAATAPFSILGALVGGADLQHIPFPAGSAEPDSQTQSLAQALFKVMSERPSLNLQLRGQFSTADAEALVAESLGRGWAGEGWPGLELALHDRRLRRQMLRAYERQNLGSVDALPVPQGADPEQQEIAQARTAFQALVRAGLASQPVERLQQLADARAAVLRDQLQSLGLEAGRLALQAAATEPMAEGGVGLGVSAP